MRSSVANKMCSFCGRQGSSRNRLAGGLGAMICVECVAHYHAIFASKKRMAASTRPVWDEMSDTELLSTLPLILKSAEQNAAFAREWVELLRTRNISWAEIGKALGVSRQAAWERFASRPAEKSDETA